MKIIFLLIFISAFCLTVGHAEESIPPVVGELPMSTGNGKWCYGSAHDGVRLGILSAENEYRLNHRINVWTVAEWERSGPRVASQDDAAVYEESYIYIMAPDGKLVAKAGVGAPIDRLLGAISEGGGVSDHLHKAIRKPGTYTLQWKTQHWESGKVTFTVKP